MPKGRARRSSALRRRGLEGGHRRRGQGAGQALADELGEAADFAHHDVSDAASWGTLVEHTTSRFGSVDVLANNAGILRFGEIETMPTDEVELLWRVNQMANCTAYAATKWAIRGMTKCAAVELGPKGIRVTRCTRG